jgi:cytochrome c oxidase subunit 4
MARQPDHSLAHRRHTNPVLVFGILTIATILEVVVTLFHLPKNILVLILMAIAFVKAGLVAAYYMHLRYEHWIYTAIFITPALFAVFLIFILVA